MKGLNSQVTSAKDFQSDLQRYEPDGHSNHNSEIERLYVRPVYLKLALFRKLQYLVGVYICVEVLVRIYTSPERNYLSHAGSLAIFSCKYIYTSRIVSINIKRGRNLLFACNFGVFHYSNMSKDFSNVT